MLLGAGVALLTSMAWAVSSIILKSLTAKIDSLSINTIRMMFGSVLLLAIVTLTGKTPDIAAIPPLPLAYVIASGILAMAIGDTIYIKSLSMLDASIAFPVSQCAFVVIASLAAILLLDEPYTWITAAGAVLVMFGIYLIASGQNINTKADSVAQISKLGIAIALLAAVVWTGSTIALKIGAAGIDPFVVAAIRISVSAMVLTGFALPRQKIGIRRLKSYGIKSLVLIMTAGLLTYGIAAVGYVSAIQMIGAGKTVLLTTSAPLFALPFSILILKEKPTRSTLIGTGASIVGVCLVVV